MKNFIQNFIFSLELRYQQVIMRARFEVNREEKDSRKSQLLLADGCKQLWQNRHYKSFRCIFFIFY